MQININNEKFADIEDGFSRLKSNENDVAALRKISDALSSLMKKSIKVETVSPTNPNREYFIMSVYPEESTITKIVDAILNEEKDAILAKIWNDSSSWTIEIDTRILSSKFNMTEKELTALILHEIGHIVYSNSIPMRIAKIMKIKYAMYPMASKQLLKDTVFSKLLLFPIVNACEVDRNKVSLRNEIAADKYAMQSGYGKDLKSAIDKIIIYAGSDVSADKQMDELMGFSVDSLIALQNRQNNIVRKNMAVMVSSAPGRFAKNIASNIANTFNGSKTTSVTEDVKDKYLWNKIDSILNSMYINEGIFNGIHKLKKLDPADIDYIGIKINDIRSNDDKIMIVSYIYNKIDVIDYYIALIDSRNPKYVIPHSKESLIQMRNTLDKYRIDAINKKIPDVSYGINIQYPTGYEG